MVDKSFFAMVDRMRLIERWSLMRSFSKENVCEHSFQVALIVQALFFIRKHELASPTLPECPLDLGNLLSLALLHDATEVITGDLPTPVKYYNPEIKASYRLVEDLAARRLLDLLGSEVLRDEYAPYINPETSGTEDKLAKLFIKAADKISALIKCIQEVSLGNSEFLQAAAKTRERIKALGLAEADYFVEQYVPAFSLSLDDMNRNSLDCESDESDILQDEFSIN